MHKKFTKLAALSCASILLVTNSAVAFVAAVFDIPAGKQLGYSSADALYTFNSFSDIHFDEEHFGETPAYWWEYSEAHWAQALAYAANLCVDFIVSSGDQVTNAKLANLDKEWQAYQLILAQSDHVNPIYKSGGNHEVRQDDNVPLELQMFINGSGLNGSIDRNCSVPSNLKFNCGVGYPERDSLIFSHILLCTSSHASSSNTRSRK